MMRQFFLILCTCASVHLVQGQTEQISHDSEPVSEDAEHEAKGEHVLTLGLGHTHIAQSKQEGKTQYLVAPSWSLSYEYYLSHRWAVGLQTELIMESFIIENSDEDEIERNFPLAIIPIGVYKASEHIGFLIGIGEEFAEGENLPLTRLGVFGVFKIPGEWEVGAELVWDSKWNHYNSWTLGFTVGKILGKR